MSAPSPRILRLSCCTLGAHLERQEDGVHARVDVRGAPELAHAKPDHVLLQPKVGVDRVPDRPFPPPSASVNSLDPTRSCAIQRLESSQLSSAGSSG
eukprot:98453-Prorocentrum_minimum.AAC.1